MMRDDPAQFKALVQETLRRHAAAINTLAARGMRFWDYGNAFLIECFRAGALIEWRLGTRLAARSLTRAQQRGSLRA